MNKAKRFFLNHSQLNPTHIIHHSDKFLLTKKLNMGGICLKGIVITDVRKQTIKCKILLNF